MSPPSSCWTAQVTLTMVFQAGQVACFIDAEGGEVGTQGGAAPESRHSSPLQMTVTAVMTASPCGSTKSQKDKVMGWGSHYHQPKPTAEGMGALDSVTVGLVGTRGM